MAQDLPSDIIAGISFVGRSGGAVKTLAGFRKGHHTVPDAASAVTQAFLGKICAAELGGETEDLFQRARTGLGYKRKDLGVSLTPPTAVLSAKDFTVDFSYALDERDPSRYVVTRMLHGLRSAELARTDEFAAIFAGAFSEISFGLKKGARVEAVIDLIEHLDGEGGLAVDYPADCRECMIRVTGVAAAVRCTGAALEMVFPRAGSPGDLMVEFAAVRGAFAVSRELAGMIG